GGRTRGRELVGELWRHAVSVEEGSARALAQVADTEAPQGIVAVVEPRIWVPGDILLGGEHTAALVIDGVQDPGNVGTLIRTAHALGAAGTIVRRGTADTLNPKALRVAIPLAQGAESLNVAVAAGILLFEVTRGR